MNSQISRCIDPKEGFVDNDSVELSKLKSWAYLQ